MVLPTIGGGLPIAHDMCDESHAGDEGDADGNAGDEGDDEELYRWVPVTALISFVIKQNVINNFILCLTCFLIAS
jgi:hypothetical protein